MAIDADSSGFLLGERRLKEMSEGINKTELNTKEILKVLTDSLNDLKKSQEKFTSTLSDAIEQPKRKKARDASNGQDNNRQQNIESIESQRARESTNDITNTQRRKALDSERRRQSESNSSVQERVRDNRGRFIGSGSNSSSNDNIIGGSETEKQSFFKRMKDAFKGGINVGSVGDTRGIDPTIDALGELKDIVSPVGGAFSRMSGKALSIFAGRSRKRKNEEVLPEEQAKANKIEQRSDARRNKLLERLIDAVRRNNNGGGGLLGNLLGGLGKGKGGLLGTLLKGGKGLLKKIPFLGALIGGGMLAKDWGSLDNKGKGKGVGSVVGMVAGGALGSFLGPAGTIAGGALGTYLGGIFGEKVGEWTDSLKTANFAEIFKGAIDGILKFGLGGPLGTAYSAGKSAGGVLLNAGRSVGGVLSNAGNAIGGAFTGAKDYVSEKLGFSSEVGKGELKGPKERQLAMYNSLRKAGFSEEQSLALNGQIGRENDYGDAMFATHVDPAKDGKGKDIINGGVLSWNNKRYEKFKKHMQAKGLMDKNGQMPKTQATLDAQAEFIKQEVNSPDYKGKLKNFLENPHQDPKAYEKELGANYVGWAYGQDTIRGKNGTRVPFNWKYQQSRADDYIKKGRDLAKQQDSELKNEKTQAIPGTIKRAQTTAVFKPNAARPTPIKLPAVTPELAKLGGKSSLMPASTTPKDTNMGQNVSDRKLAHIFTGGIGFDN